MRVGIFATTFEIKRSLTSSDILASAPSSLLKLSMHETPYNNFYSLQQYDHISLCYFANKK